MIVLSSDEAVQDLLGRWSGNYSGRTDIYIGQTIASGGLRLVVMVSYLTPYESEHLLTPSAPTSWQLLAYGS